MAAAAIALCFLLREMDGRSQVLLGMKKTGFGRGKIVGIGGHVEAGETDAEAAIREVREEAGVGILAGDLRDAGIVRFVFPARPEWDMDTRLFTAVCWEGEPTASAEIAPAWFDTAALPVDRMWQDADHWLPVVLEGGRVNIIVTMDNDNEGVASSESLLA